MNETGPTDDLAHRVRSFVAATPSLLKPEYRGQTSENPFRGHCYVASEAYFHLQGGHDSDYTSHQLTHEGESHWFLRDGDGGIVDLTADQFETRVPYEDATGRGFLTSGPSKRAQTVIKGVSPTSTDNTVVGLDVDGVIAEQNEAFCRYIEETHGITFPETRVDCRNPDIPEIDSTYVEQIREATSQPGFYGTMNTVPGAVEAVNELHEAPGITVAIVTHRKYEHAADTREWLDDNGIPYDLFYANAPSNKGELGIDVLVDDYPQNVKEAITLGCDGIAFARFSHVEDLLTASIPTAVDSPGEQSQSVSALIESPREQWTLLADKLIN